METVLLNLLTFFAGLFLGNRLALGRDKRKEFNEAAMPIRSWLLKEAENPSPYSRPPSTVEVDTFTNCLPPWKRKGFRIAYERQWSARQSAEVRDSFGQVLYSKEEIIKARINACLSYSKRR